MLVNAAIKKELCRVKDKKADSWMDKVRPWYGHADHIHVRLKCPADSPNCRKQPPVPGGDGCGKELDYWFSDKVLHPKPHPEPAKPPKALDARRPAGSLQKRARRAGQRQGGGALTCGTCLVYKHRSCLTISASFANWKRRCCGWRAGPSTTPIICAQTTTG